MANCTSKGIDNSAAESASVKVLTPATDTLVKVTCFDTTSYRLYPNDTGFSLVNMTTGRKYAIPQILLTPTLDPAYKDAITGLMQFDSVVTAFPLGENMVGIHLSSYDIGEGSMALAQGVDAFLAIDLLGKKMLPEVLNLGVTKQRSKYMGYLSAEYTHLLVSRIAGAKFFSLVTYKEKINVSIEDSGKHISVDGPYYEQTPLHWYVFDGKKWQYDPKLDKYLPVGDGGELPMIHLIMSPVEYAKREYDRRAEMGY